MTSPPRQPQPGRHHPLSGARPALPRWCAPAWRAGLACITLAGASGAAQAAFTVYTDVGAFNAAVSALGIDNFDNLAAGAIAGPLLRNAGAWGYRAQVDPDTRFIGDGSPVPPGQFYAAGTASDGWLSTNSATDTLRLDQLGAARAVGGYFFGTDVDGALQAGSSISLQVADAGGVWTQTLANPGTGNFVGLFSDTTLLWSAASAVQPAAGSTWVALNDLSLAAAPVPEPQAWALLCGGLAGGALLRHLAGRRRRAGAV